MYDRHTAYKFLYYWLVLFLCPAYTDKQNASYVFLMCTGIKLTFTLFVTLWFVRVLFINSFWMINLNVAITKIKCYMSPTATIKTLQNVNSNLFHFSLWRIDLDLLFFALFYKTRQWTQIKALWILLPSDNTLSNADLYCCTTSHSSMLFLTTSKLTVRKILICNLQSFKLR